MSVSLNSFLKAYQQAIDDGNAALFIGAGMSVPVGFVPWNELLREIAEDLGLDIDEESDLIGLAQYHVNHRRGRDAINQKIMREYTKDSTPTLAHQLIARLPIDTVWTTNYDRLLEDAFEAERKRVDRKIRRKDLARTLPKRDVVLYKMHGDVESPDDAVLTKDDYERYNDPRNRQLFTIQLQADLVSKTFLFLGLSFTDPNIDYILGRVRSLVDESRRDHYWVTRNADADPRATKRDKTLQKHRVEDLKTYGIQTVFIDDYGAIPDKILNALLLRANRKNVFLSGSADSYEPMKAEQAGQLLRGLGTAIIDGGFNVVCGMGQGVGDAFVLGAVEGVYRGPTHLDDRTILRPFPQQERDVAKRKALWTRYREEMLQRAGVAIFVFGNKQLDGNITDANGVMEEFAFAKALGVAPLPLGATGYAAKAVWDEMKSDLPKFFGDRAAAIGPHFDVLGDASASGAQLISATVNALKVLVPA